MWERWGAACCKRKVIEGTDAGIKERRRGEEMAGGVEGEARDVEINELKHRCIGLERGNVKRSVGVRRDREI